MTRWKNAGVACLGAALLVASTAAAHELECEKKVNGQSTYTITSYPAEITWTLKVTNIHPTSPSEVLDLEDELLEGLGFNFNPDAPFTLALNAFEDYEFVQTIANAEACATLASADGTNDSDIDNTFIVRWDSGEDQCSARVVCLTPPPPPPPGPTRTMGFFKTHLVPLEACIDQGPIDLGPGFEEIDTLAEAAGLLHASPAKYEDDTHRSFLDQARFLLARQTLVAICNQRLFGTDPDPADLIDDALAALAGTNCTLILALAEQVDDFNNSGDNVAFPEGFEKGPSTPQTAAGLAEGNDPSIETTDVCTASASYAPTASCGQERG